MCPAPSRGDELPICLPLTPAQWEQFNSLQLCPPVTEGGIPWSSAAGRGWVSSLGGTDQCSSTWIPGWIPPQRDRHWHNHGQRCPACIQ